MWRGILVKGDPNYDQFDESQQGVLEVKNGATISNAEVAVYVGEFFVPNSESSVGSNKGNGIIRLTDALFFNNQKDVVMRPNVLSLIGGGSATFVSKSLISNCTFKSNADMLTDPILNKEKLESINLNGVQKLLISGNTFENQDNSISSSNSWDAIVAQQSQFTVEASSSTNPPNYDDPNVFTNLKSGIRVN